MCSSLQFIELDLGDVKQIHFDDDDDIMVFLLNQMSKCMPLAQGIERYKYCIIPA